VADRTYRAVIGAGHLALRALDLRVRADGAERLPASGPVVLASNHVSFPDFLFIGKALVGTGRLVRFLCRDDIWDSPAGPALTAMRHVPVDRTAPAGTYLQARSLLRDGEVVCVFPEAGISASYVVRALMPGAVALARETGAPMLPVSVWGGQRLWPQKRSLDDPFPKPTISRGRTVDVRLGEPLSVPPDADLTATTRVLGERLQAGLEELQRLPEHRPRPGEWAPWYPAHLGGHAVERRESFAHDVMPRSAVTPTWGPGL
jgi:1-acyl-sn-glycerol-3-phosphate acyltransferase